jgi:hypothetical protein
MKPWSHGRRSTRSRASNACPQGGAGERSEPPLFRPALANIGENGRSLHPNVLLPALTSVLGFVFVGILVRQQAERPRSHILVWSLGLLWYAIAAATEALGGAFAWNPALYRLWYLSGAIGVAAYLGAGTVYLHQKEAGFRSLTVVCIMLASAPALATRHLDIGFFGLSVAVIATVVLSLRPAWFAHTVFASLVVASLLAAYIILTAQVDTAALPTTPDEIVSGQAFDANTRALTPPLNISGAVLLLFGAVASARAPRANASCPIS